MGPLLRLAALLLSLAAVAGTPGPFEASRLAVRAYGLDEGLPNPRVHCLFLDSRGQLWAGTQDGPALLSGRGWLAYPLPADAPSTYVRAMAEFPSGTLWFGTEDGGLWSLKDGLWTHHAGLRDLPVQRINALKVVLEQGRPTLLVGTGGGGLLRYDGTRFLRIAEVRESWIWCLEQLQDPDGTARVWAGGRDEIWTYHQRRWTRIEDDQGRSPTGANGLAQTTSAQGRPEVWISAWDRGVGRWDGRRLSLDPRFPSRNPTCLAVTRGRDGRDQLWVGTYGSGLHRLDAEGWRSMGPKDGIPSTGIYCITPNPGRRPLLWIGSRGAGVVALDPTGWRSLGPAEGLPSQQANCFLETLDAEGRPVFWVGTDQGVARWDARGLRVETTRHGLPDNFIADLEEIPGPRGPEVWAATIRGLARRVGERWIPFTAKEGLTFQRTTCLGLGREDDGTPTVVVGADGGLAHYRHGRWTLTQGGEGLPSPQVNALLSTQDPDGAWSLWVGTRGGGVSRLRKGAWTVFGRSAGLINLSVYGLAQSRSPDGRRWLWAGMVGGGGFGRLDMNHPERGFQVWTQATLPGLPSNSILRLEVTADGHLYLTTPRGIARLDLVGQDGQPSSPETFTPADGLPSAATNAGASLVDRAGRIWVGTARGVAVLDPFVEMMPPAPPSPILEQVTVNGRTVSTAQGLRLDHHASRVVVHFALPVFHRREDIRYHVTLQGLDEDAGTWTGQPFREFSTLPSGRYLLRIRARDGLDREPPPLELPVTVEPPPWLSGWALAAYALVFLGIGGVILRLRTRLLEVRTQELERLVSERTEALQDANLALHTQSLRDPLTGLANRRFLDATVSGTAAALLRRVLVEGPSHAAENGYLVFLIVDLDHFKEVNDRHGHPAGDRVLIQTAERLRAAVRDGDHVIRWGGEEFVVVAADAAPAATAGLAERIRTAIGGRPFDLPDGQRLTRTCSLGFAAYPFLPGFPDILSWYDVLTLADKCLYRAKEAGRNQWFGLLPPDGEPPSGLPDRDDLLAASLDELVEDGHACLERGPEAPTSGAPPAAR